MTTYSYSVANDTLSGDVNARGLHSEIASSSITIALDSVNVNGDVIDCVFKAALSGAEQTTLDGLVAAHDATPTPNDPTQVEVSNAPQVQAIKGVGDFETFLTHDLTGTAQTYTLEPGSGEVYRLEKAEVQFTSDIKMASATTPTELYFDVWAYNPLFDAGQSVDADDPTFVPGVSSGNPLRFLVERQVYESIKDVFNKGNAHFHSSHAYDGMTNPISTVQFNYPKWIELKASQGAQIRVSTKDNVSLEGEFCTVSFLVSKASE